MHTFVEVTAEAGTAILEPSGLALCLVRFAYALGAARAHQKG